MLRGQIENSAIKSRMVMLPRTGALSYESMACVLPANDSAWRDFVNQTLALLLDGVSEFRGRYVEIYDRWFGPGGPLYYPLDRATSQRLANANIWLR